MNTENLFKYLPVCCGSVMGTNCEPTENGFDMIRCPYVCVVCGLSITLCYQSGEAIRNNEPKTIMGILKEKAIDINQNESYKEYRERTRIGACNAGINFKTDKTDNKLQLPTINEIIPRIKKCTHQGELERIRFEINTNLKKYPLVELVYMLEEIEIRHEEINYHVIQSKIKYGYL